MRRTPRLVAVLLLAGCTTASDRPDPRIEAARDYIKEVTGDDLKIAGLRLTVRQATVDGRTIRISGTVENRYDQNVEGVRYIVELWTAGESPSVVESFYEESEDTILAAGEDRATRIEIENPMRATAPGRFTVQAHPIKLDGKVMPPPTGWK